MAPMATKPAPGWTGPIDFVYRATTPTPLGGPMPVAAPPVRPAIDLAAPDLTLKALPGRIPYHEGPAPTVVGRDAALLREAWVRWRGPLLQFTAGRSALTIHAACAALRAIAPDPLAPLRAMVDGLALLHRNTTRWTTLDGLDATAGSERMGNELFRAPQITVMRIDTNLTDANKCSNALGDHYGRALAQWGRQMFGAMQGSVTYEAGGAAIKVVGTSTDRSLLEPVFAEFPEAVRRHMHVLVATDPDLARRERGALHSAIDRFPPRATAAITHIHPPAVATAPAQRDQYMRELTLAIHVTVEEELKRLAVCLSCLRTWQHQRRREFPPTQRVFLVTDTERIIQDDPQLAAHYATALRQGHGYIPKTRHWPLATTISLPQFRRPFHDAGRIHNIRGSGLLDHLTALVDLVAQGLAATTHEGWQAIANMLQLPERAPWGPSLLDMGLLFHRAARAELDPLYPNSHPMKVPPEIARDLGHPLVAAATRLAMRTREPLVLAVADVDGLKAHLKTYCPGISDHDIFELLDTIHRAFGHEGIDMALGRTADSHTYLIPMDGYLWRNVRLHPTIAALPLPPDARLPYQLLQQVQREVRATFRDRPFQDETKVSNGEGALTRVLRWIREGEDATETHSAWERPEGSMPFLEVLGLTIAFRRLPRLVPDATPTTVRRWIRGFRKALHQLADHADQLKTEALATTGRKQGLGP